MELCGVCDHQLMTAVVESSQLDPAPTPVDHRRRNRWIVAGVVALLVLAGGLTAIIWHRQHDAPRPLTMDSTAIRWLGNVPTRDAQAGPYSAAITTAGRGDQRTFVLYIHNPSSVTQTVLGLGYSSRHTATPEHITLGSKNPDTTPADGAPFAKPPVAIPPHAYRELHYTVRVDRCLQTTAQLYWTELYLLVRSGGHTRRETLPFGTESSAYVIQGNARRC